MVDEPGIDELSHQAGGDLACLVFFPELHDLLLELLDLGVLGLLIHLLLRCFQHLGLDLSLHSSALATHLEHIGRDALRH